MFFRKYHDLYTWKIIYPWYGANLLKSFQLIIIHRGLLDHFLLCDKIDLIA